MRIMKIKPILLLISLLFLSFSYAEKLEVTPALRMKLLRELDSIEVIIQNNRRTGEDIEKYIIESEKIKRAIDQCNIELKELNIPPEEISLNQTATQKRTSATTAKKKKGSFLDILIIITGATAILSLLLLGLIQLFHRVIRPALRKKKAAQDANSIDSEGVAALERLKTGHSNNKTEDTLSALNEISALADMVRTQHPLEEKSSPFPALEESEVESNIPEKSIDHPEIMEEKVSEKTTEEREPAYEDDFSLFDEQPKKVVEKQEKPPTMMAPPLQVNQYNVISGNKKNIMPTPPPMMPTTSSDEAQKSVQSVMQTEPPEKEGTWKATGVREEIVSAFDTGDDPIDIARRVNMSVDQIMLILRLAGR